MNDVAIVFLAKAEMDRRLNDASGATRVSEKLNFQRPVSIIQCTAHEPFYVALIVESSAILMVISVSNWLNTRSERAVIWNVVLISSSSRSSVRPLVLPVLACDIADRSAISCVALWPPFIFWPDIVLDEQFCVLATEKHILQCRSDYNSGCCKFLENAQRSMRLEEENHAHPSKITDFSNEIVVIFPCSSDIPLNSNTRLGKRQYYYLEVILYTHFCKSITVLYTYIGSWWCLYCEIPLQGRWIASQT